MTPIRMLSTDDAIAEIRRLYFSTTRQTIEADLAKALDLLKSLPSEEDRDRAAVYMDGLAQMRSDWARAGRKTAKGPSAGRGAAPARNRDGKTGKKPRR